MTFNTYNVKPCSRCGGHHVSNEYDELLGYIVSTCADCGQDISQPPSTSSEEENYEDN